MSFNRQRPRLRNQKLVNCNILPALLAVTALLDTAEWRLGRGTVTDILHRISFDIFRVLMSHSYQSDHTSL